MGLFDDVTGWLSNNSDWLKPVLSLGSNVYKGASKRDNQNDYLNILKAQEDQRFAETNAYNDAARAYNEQVAAASAANSAASARASAMNQAAALAAQNKANKQMNKTYNKNKKLYEPFKDTALKLLPQMTQAYETGLGGYNMLNAYLNRPEELAKLSSSKPQWATSAPTPSWAKK